MRTSFRGLPFFSQDDVRSVQYFDAKSETFKGFYRRDRYRRTVQVAIAPEGSRLKSPSPKAFPRAPEQTHSHSLYYCRPAQ